MSVRVYMHVVCVCHCVVCPEAPVVIASNAHDAGLGAMTCLTRARDHPVQRLHGECPYCDVHTDSAHTYTALQACTPHSRFYKLWGLHSMRWLLLSMV